MNEPSMPGEDVAFERLLLGAGRADALRHDQTEAALVRFAASLTALQGGVGALAAVKATASSNRAMWVRFLAVAKWIALGALAGTAATLAWLRPLPRELSSLPVVAAVPTAATPSPAKQASPVVQSLPSAPAQETQTGAATPNNTLHPRRIAILGSDLAAEVTALDGARTALSIGAVSDAERQLASYRRRFVHGALRSEAEVLAVELLLAQGRTKAAARAAEHFIAEHPRDPQVSRVRALTE